MATYVVTLTNWNDPSFWIGIIESGAGHTLDFSQLPTNFTIAFDGSGSTTTISDGTSTFTIGESGSSGTDATLGAGTDWSFFTTLFGSQGNDTLTGGAADDTLFGGGGNDTLDGGTGTGDRVVFAGNHDDYVFDITDTDQITVTHIATGDVSIVRNFEQIAFADGLFDLIIGTDDDEYLGGDDGLDDDFIIGGAGTDTLDGGAGNDIIYGGDGRDLVYGGDGADTVYGGLGNDRIAGGAGNDSIQGGDGRDLLSGEAGDDTLAGGSGDDLIRGGTGQDSLIGGDGVDWLVGNDGNDTIDGGTGNDAIFGDAPDSGFEPGASLLGSYANQVNTDTTGYQSPPITTVLGNGQVAYVWTNNAHTDNNLDMVPQIRIANADGTWATSQIDLDALFAIDGLDAYDWDNMDVDLLPDGNLVISYVRSSVEPGGDEPVFSIIDPSQLGTPQQYVLINQEIQSNDTTGIESPPFTTVLDNGQVLFVWSKNAHLDDTPTMELQGRIFDPATNSWTGGDFLISDIAVDGTDSADVDNLDIVQLAGGNIIVSWARSNPEAGGTEPVYQVLRPDGTPLGTTREIQSNDTTAYESPADIVALDNGNWMAVWTKNGYSDDTPTMTLHGRVFDASGNEVVPEFQVSQDAVDGFNGYDVENFTVVQLGNGNVVVGFVENSLSGGTDNSPQFTIVGPDGTIVAQDIEIAVAQTHPWPGAPVIAAIGESGHFVAVYAEGNQAQGVPTGLNFRIYDGQGNPVTVEGSPVTGQVNMVGATDAAAMSGLDNFDWSQLDVDYNPFNNTFTASWVSQNDGSATGVFTSGPIAGVPQGVNDGDDSLTGGDGNDTLFGAGGADRLDGGTGNDTIDAGTGSDTIVLTDGYGDDTVLAGADEDNTDIDVIDASALTADGVDVVLSGSGVGDVSSSQGTVNFDEVEAFVLSNQADTFDGSNSADGVSVDGGGGDDTLTGSSGDDTLRGGAGNDVLTARGGDGGIESLFGGDGDDLLIESNGSSLMDGGAGSDRFEVGLGSSTIIGGDGPGDVDTLSATESDDRFEVTFDGTGSGTYDDLTDVDSGSFSQIEAVAGSSGNDTVDATLDGGGVQLSGNGGDDTLIGGSGNDTIAGGTGNDTLTGGDGSNLFVYAPGDGLDTITDFTPADPADLDDNDTTNNNFIDLSTYYDHLSELYQDQADDGILNQSNTVDTRGNAVDYGNNTQFDTDGTPNNEGLIFTGATADNASFTVENTGVVCFAAGTLIMTPQGEVPIETLRPGDLVLTRDNGPQPLVWIGRRHVSAADMDANARLKPVRISPAVSGAHSPLIVSPQHGMLVNMDGAETLVRATHLARLAGGQARVMRGCRSVTYLHLMFEAHQIIFAAGAPTESFYPGPQAYGALSDAARIEINTLFPSLDATDPDQSFGERARRFAAWRDLPDHLSALRAAA